MNWQRNKANHNDIASLEILRDYTKNLARYIFNMQMLLDLENISIGGELVLSRYY